MSSDELKSFKIGDSQPKRLTPTRKDAEAARKEAEAEAASVGFRRIEELLDDHDEDTVRAKLDGLESACSERLEAAKSHKDKAAAQKAQKAIVQVRGLIEHLFDIRRQIAEAEQAE